MVARGMGGKCSHVQGHPPAPMAARDTAALGSGKMFAPRRNQPRRPCRTDDEVEPCGDEERPSLQPLERGDPVGPEGSLPWTCCIPKFRGLAGPESAGGHYLPGLGRVGTTMWAGPDPRRLWAPEPSFGEGARVRARLGATCHPSTSLHRGQ